MEPRRIRRIRSLGPSLRRQPILATSIADSGIEIDRQGLGDKGGRVRLGKDLEPVGRRLDAADVPLLKCLGKDRPYVEGSNPPLATKKQKRYRFCFFVFPKKNSLTG